MSSRSTLIHLTKSPGHGTVRRMVGTVFGAVAARPAPGSEGGRRVPVYMKSDLAARSAYQRAGEGWPRVFVLENTH